MAPATSCVPALLLSFSILSISVVIGKSDLPSLPLSRSHELRTKARPYTDYILKLPVRDLLPMQQHSLAVSFLGPTALQARITPLNEKELNLQTPQSTRTLSDYASISFFADKDLTLYTDASKK